jgi:Protein of unknown function (DUF1549)/Protein of unknown function (DUF1553)
MKILLVVLIAAPLFGAGAAKAPVAVAPAPKGPVSFRLDVMPVFFRAGCNSGGCHGAAAGKDGFHLSLFGYDPAGDYYRLTQQIVGRRIDLAVPEQSLLLLKATGMVPHSGGRRFKNESELYQTLLRWIQQGAPDDKDSTATVTGIALVPDKVIFSGKVTKQPLQLIAKYSDGTSRPVNRLGLYLTNNKATADIDDNGLVTAGKRGDTFVFARFAKYTAGAEIIVLPQDKHFKWPKIAETNYIDQVVDTKLQQLRIIPSGLAPDDEFVRRVYFDLIGLPPTPDEFSAFVGSKDKDKRSKLVDTLLTRDEFNDLWATKWAEMLKIVSDNNSSFGTDRKAAYEYYEWIREQVKKNTPLDKFARMQIASKGSNLQDPAVNLYTMLPQGQYDAKAVAQDVAQIFTGMRIQCAQCHNHPFDRWTQDDYYSFVSFFTGVKRKVASEARELYVYDDPNAPPAKHLLTGQLMPARFLGGASPDVKGKDPRLALAEWLTAKENPLFRQNMANRVWAHFFGRGIVEPVDDVRISNPPSNRELVEALGQHLADYDFDLKRLIRDICNSRTYQLSSNTNESNKDDDQMFSHAHLRRLRADVLLDSIAQVTQTPSRFNEEPAGLRATQLYEGSRRSGSYFLKTFGLSQRDSVNVSETRTEPTLAQALHLVNGDTIQGKINQSPVIRELLNQKKKPEEIIDELFLRSLSRKPSEPERKKMMALVSATPSDRKAYDDIFWALLNSTEFSFNH